MVRIALIHGINSHVYVICIYILFMTYYVQHNVVYCTMGMYVHYIYMHVFFGIIICDIHAMCNNIYVYVYIYICLYIYICIYIIISM
jgi:hypothetical protein